MLHNYLVKYCGEIGEAGRNVGKCVQFNYQRETWEIFYQDANGKAIQCSRGLALVKKDIWGNQLSKETLEKDMTHKKVQAIEDWNRLDASGRPRLEVPELPDDIKHPKGS